MLDTPINQRFIFSLSRFCKACHILAKKLKKIREWPGKQSLCWGWAISSSDIKVVNHGQYRQALFGHTSMSVMDKSQIAISTFHLRRGPLKSSGHRKGLFQIGPAYTKGQNLPRIDRISQICLVRCQMEIFDTQFQDLILSLRRSYFKGYHIVHLWVNHIVLELLFGFLQNDRW